MQTAAVNRIRAVESRLPRWLQAPRTYKTGVHMPNAAGTARWNDISLNQQTTRDLAGARGREAQKYAQRALLHEIVHSRQRGLGDMSKRPALEAGAEVLSRKLGKQMFGLPTDGGAYNAEVDALRGQYGDGAARAARAALKGAPAKGKPVTPEFAPGSKQQNQRLKVKRSARPGVIARRMG